MSTVKEEVAQLVRLGIQAYSHTMRIALHAMLHTQTREAIDNAIQRLPDTCRAKAQRLMRRADEEGLSVSKMQYYLSVALDENKPDIATLMEDVHTFGYEQASEIHGVPFVYMT